MANEQNLIPFSARTQRERSEIARKGAQATNEKRRKRKSMRERAEYYLSIVLKQENADLLTDDIVKLLDLDGSKETDLQDAMIMAQINKSIKQADTQAFNSVRELVGEKVTEVKVNASVDEKVKELHNLLDEIK